MTKPWNKTAATTNRRMAMIHSLVSHLASQHFYSCSDDGGSCSILRPISNGAISRG